MWRTTAYSTPELWAGLSITLDDAFEKSWRDYGTDGGIILRWLDRAGERPLTLKVLPRIDPLASTLQGDFKLGLGEKCLLSSLDAFVLLQGSKLVPTSSSKCTKFCYPRKFPGAGRFIVPAFLHEQDGDPEST